MTVLPAHVCWQLHCVQTTAFKRHHGQSGSLVTRVVRQTSLKMLYWTRLIYKIEEVGPPINCVNRQ